MLSKVALSDLQALNKTAIVKMKVIWSLVMIYHLTNTNIYNYNHCKVKNNIKVLIKH
jgi:hypothetical protein